MTKQLLTGLAMAALLLGSAALAQAGLTTIGTADYNGSKYDLLWDDDISLVWLDYTNRGGTWEAQNTWASGLNLESISTPGWDITWKDTSWRLPTAVNQTDSEMGHVFIQELGNTAGGKVTNFGSFTQLSDRFTYWSGTATSSDNAWAFHMESGLQALTAKAERHEALAVRQGDVSPVPTPGAVWLLGSGLLGMIGIRRRYFS